MVFYNHFYIVTCFVGFLIKASGIEGIKIMNSFLHNIKPSKIRLQSFAIVNNTSDSIDFETELNPNDYCLKLEPNMDCDVLEIIRDDQERMTRGTTKTLKIVAPHLKPFERHGYCIFYLDSVSNNRKRGIKRIPVKITVDRRIKNNQPMELVDTVTVCDKINEDPLNNRKPVDFDTYNNDKRSNFDRRLKRCVDIPKCISDPKNDVPTLVYNPKSNESIKEEFITKDDLDFVKVLSNGKRNKLKDILIIENVPKIKHTMDKREMDTMRETENLIRNENGASIRINNDAISKINSFKSTIKKYIVTNKLTLSVFSIVILVQCCLICTMVYCLSKNYQCCKKKTLVSKFFNYRQDASVTTPLIGTSNIDTDTTDFQYMKDSSNVNIKTKCYEACDKDWKKHIKISISDDILLKCLGRRDWKRIPNKPEAIVEMDSTNQEVITNHEEIKDSDISLQNKEAVSDKFMKSGIKVNFENEAKSKVNEKQKMSSIVKNTENKSEDKKENKEYTECDISEKEIKCHSYNNDISNVNQPSTHSKHFEVYKLDEIKETTSVSTEKGAQAAFSNESIDDFLSGRGVLLTGDNVSKYSISSVSNYKKPSISSGVSSKTSKNHFLKSLLSLVSRSKSKIGPASEPEYKKTSENYDIEVIHDVSHASIQSSSNNDSDHLNHFIITKDSTTSL